MSQNNLSDRSHSNNIPTKPENTGVETVQILLNMLLLSQNDELKKELKALRAQLDRSQLDYGETEALREYREKRDMPTIAPYEFKTWGEDNFSVEFKGRLNIAQFSCLTGFCVNINSDIQVTLLKYIDENGRYNSIENPSPEQLKAFKNSNKTEYIKNTHMNLLSDIEVDMKAVFPSYLKSPTEPIERYREIAIGKLRRDLEY